LGEECNITGIHSPTNSYPVKDKFCKTIKDVLDKISSTNEIFLMEDYNT
jgi:hypothetical protein